MHVIEEFCSLPRSDAQIRAPPRPILLAQSTFCFIVSLSSYDTHCSGINTCEGWNHERRVVESYLILVKRHILDGSSLVVHRLHGPLPLAAALEHLLDLVVAQDPTLARARARHRCPTEPAPGLGARGVREREGAPVEPEAHDQLGGRDADAPEQLGGQLDLGQVGVALDDAADGVVAVPDAVQVVRHEVDPVGVLDEVGQVEPAQVPEGRGRREAEAEARAAGVERAAQGLEQQDEVLHVLGLAAAVWGAGVFPVNVYAVVPCRRSILSVQQLDKGQHFSYHNAS